MPALAEFELGRYLSEVDEVSPFLSKGRVKALVGLLIRATVPDAWIGELCLIHNPRSPQPVKAEVVGFENGDVLLMPRIGDHPEPGQMVLEIQQRRIGIEGERRHDDGGQGYERDPAEAPFEASHRRFSPA